MRRIILRMIATGSLSAFSASALHGAGALAGQGGVRQVKAPLPLAAQGGAGAVSTRPAPGQAAVGAAAAGRPLPRGSLLDLSV